MAKITVYRKDDLNGVEIEDTQLADFKKNGYTDNYDEAEAASTTIGGANWDGSAATQETAPRIKI